MNPTASESLTDPARTTPAPPRRLAAVLWDLDGTLVDSEPYWIEAETELVAEHGGTWTHDDALGLVGRPLLEAATILAERGPVPLAPGQIVERLVGRMVAHLRAAVPWQPGAWDLLHAVRAAGVPQALVTMSYRVLADAVVDALPAGTFDAVVCGDEVERGKPDPEAYLTAASLLGVDPADCVAVEDSPGGIRSALASGARTVGVQVVVPVEPRPALTRLAALTQLDLDLLSRVASGEVVDLLA
ncbi:HAD family hydrolase [Luteimicrobium subarcticum]|uniref:HAD superfamily hydrolase (TIGR01509 family) n=1 Tax=Luteimicrobium subarcticum TaxID=620910 RepID=A0A2M8W3L1_9MICO|nr:HAD family phosphatase [Luteimicrobium subarcticum]PJI85490.1 HAD superfamily hydrolase (TIGR01509 family) [Luteimicrobium subarcticum]